MRKKEKPQTRPDAGQPENPGTLQSSVTGQTQEMSRAEILAYLEKTQQAGTKKQR